MHQQGHCVVIFIYCRHKARGGEQRRDGTDLPDPRAVPDRHRKRSSGEDQRAASWDI